MAKSTTQAPDSLLYRDISADDAGPFTDKKQGLNTGQYEKLSVEVIAEAGANPAVEIFVWSETKGEFITTGTIIAAAGAGVSHAFEFDCLGRIIFLAVTGTAGNQVRLATSGFGLSATMG